MHRAHVPGMHRAHENKWVALSVDRKKVLASSVSLEALKGKVGDTKVIYSRILPSNTSFAF